MSKRINLTLPDIVIESLDYWADLEGTKTASLGAYLIESAVKEAMEKGILPKPSRGMKIRNYKNLQHLIADNLNELKTSKLASRLDALRSGELPTEVDKVRLAMFFGVDEDDIELLI
ncbi:MAG: hypothetical protein HC835_12500 [Oscillatoriales cyanobacterium RM2_1_1]|nr:hypothetical protein [Oscillatoriales cyanobacterium SM2_3_0]NJO46374.1 hypothetical protein [Oscillatoriales cyanobacterium RM2_1_1]